MSEHWCDYCQDAFVEDHFDDKGYHKVGREYGPEGVTLSVLKGLRDLCSSRMTEGVNGKMVDADTIWPSEVLAILNQTEVREGVEWW